MQRDVGGESDIFNGGVLKLLVLMNMSFNPVYAEKSFLPNLPHTVGYLYAGKARAAIEGITTNLRHAIGNNGTTIFD